MTDDNDDRIVQSDPRLAAVQDEPWFDAAVERVLSSVEALAEHGITECSLAAGEGRLVLGDPIADAVAEVGRLPAEGMAFVVLKAPTPDGVIDASRAVRELSDRVRRANPNGYLLLLPADWSFRVMQPEMARSFAVNMIAFVSDDELEKIGLKRIEAQP